MITISRTKRGELALVFMLYRSAFPRCERKPFGRITGMVKEGRADLWTVRMDGRFAGFAATVNGPQVVLLDYLAVTKSQRGRGVGTGAMGLLNESYRDRGFFVEIESTFADAPNAREREKRKRFYVHCGMESMGTDVDVFGVRMELLGTRCRMDFESYRNFYRDNYSAWAAEHIKEVEPCTGN
ncbi:MAG: GNAT family N-acetyltransferase [Oscillospiraceae bacterium]|nr:GNAT family N-acetyltransferase [Oscillospiraceae bacterium]